MDNKTMTTLPYAAVSEHTRNRWDAAIDSARPIDERSRRLLQLALSACDSVGPSGLNATLRNQARDLWILCEQSRLSELLCCSVKTVYNTLKHLQDFGCCQRVASMHRDNTVAWVISLPRLELVEESRCPELDEIICENPNPFGYDDEFSHPEIVTDTVADPIADAFTGQVTDAFTGALTGGVTGGVTGLMNHDHDHDKNMNINPMIHDHDHEHGVCRFFWGRAGSEGSLTDDEVRRAVKRSDAKFIDQCDRAGVKAFDWPDTEHARLQRFAAWHHAATAPKLRSPVSFLKARMSDGDWTKLTAADEDWARLMIRSLTRRPAKSLPCNRPLLRTPALQSATASEPYPFLPDSVAPS